MRGLDRARCGGGEDVRGGATVRRHAGAVGQKLASVLEYDHAVAEKAPALLRVARDDPGSVMVNGIGGGTRGLVATHL